MLMHELGKGKSDLSVNVSYFMKVILCVFFMSEDKCVALCPRL